MVITGGQDCICVIWHVSEARKAVAELILRGEQPLDFMIDGDFHRGEREVRVRVGPRCSVFLPQR